MMNLELLKAKDAIFQLIGQFVGAIEFNNGELYIHNYCESALEAAFDVLGIEDNYIKLIDFCQMWEDNSRMIWAYTSPGRPFNGITADMHYKVFKEDYDSREQVICYWDEEE